MTRGSLHYQQMRGPFKPSFGLSGVVADPTLRSCHPEQLTCLRQVEGEMNSVHEVVIITITPNGSATFTSRVQSRRDDLKVAQDVSPGLELEEKGSPGGTAESIPLQPSLRDWPNC